MKYFDITATVSGNKGNTEFQNTYRAEISLDSFVSFSDIVKFTEDVKKVWKKAMNGIKAGHNVQMEVISADYEGHGATLHSTSFDRWETHSEDLAADDEGIYLRADEQYTDPCRDMYLTKDVLHDMGFTLG